MATIGMDAPPVNALSDGWVARFHEILDDLGRRDDWSVLHLRSALQLFGAGADLKQILSRLEAAEGSKRQVETAKAYQTLFARIEALPQTTLAEIGGAALGGSFELALACDLRIVANEAKMGLPEVRLGLLPGAGGTQRMTSLCGRPIALRLILGAEI